MKKVAVTWQMCGYVEMPDATTTEEAMEQFNRERDYIKLPSKAEYVDGSFELSTEDVDEMEAMVNGVK